MLLKLKLNIYLHWILKSFFLHFFLPLSFFTLHFFLSLSLLITEIHWHFLMSFSVNPSSLLLGSVVMSMCEYLAQCRTQNQCLTTLFPFPPLKNKFLHYHSKSITKSFSLKNQYQSMHLLNWHMCVTYEKNDILMLLLSRMVEHFLVVQMTWYI